MIKYKVVVNDSLLQFTEEVESLRNDGWNHVEGGFMVSGGKYYREMEKYVPLEEVAHEMAQASSALPQWKFAKGIEAISECV